ncbi:GNAT family N-acetyltransferase [Serratia entomophila]|uniref:GNAT family N-acetyltransferase n=1 Tax=Serratia entomophila TaxID=42906 RepID=A0ABY5CYN0_9GAMM|nr:GNAT family N-acetyltransferase [Serratia entomophila]USV02797.1 GNAT family N-acetyltransferase [Serratia entomophila]CAI0979677.1 Acetyltransferase (GNAT) family [Serratia entomophila]CAI0991504.1 Acetyltransferase (GNAT) family [Serratia entomophila]CAI1024423.1 Acetyltransferase (GNAT) family [Serratia entomophila]CAI1168370.1 Acetyltransferase (GNAT) family [Serratia entomophila]
MFPSNTEVTIRRITVDDKPQWLALWQGYLHFYRADIAPQVSELTFERLGNDQQMYGLVAEGPDGQLLGLMNLVFHPSTWSASGYCYIEDLYVSPLARGKKVSEKLFEQAYRLAETRGSDRVYWMTQEYNAPARSLYDKIGRRSSFIVYTR